MVPATGFAMRTENRPLAGEPAWNAVEIDYRRANHPLLVEPYLDGMSFSYVSLHCLELSIASPEPPPLALIETLRRVADANGARAVTDHLGFTHGRAQGARVGHVIAPPMTVAALDATCRNIERLQRRLRPYDFFVENLAHFFQFRGELDEGEFMRRMLERTGCGLLLDITNAYANEVNFGGSAREFLESVLPAAPRLQVHLAGGFFHAGMARYVDSHSEPIPEPVWHLFRDALQLGDGKFEAIFVERDWNFPQETGWREELRRVRARTEPAALEVSP